MNPYVITLIPRLAPAITAGVVACAMTPESRIEVPLAMARIAGYARRWG